MGAGTIGNIKKSFCYDKMQSLTFGMTANRIAMTDWDKIQVGPRVY